MEVDLVIDGDTEPEQVLEIVTEVAVAPGGDEELPDDAGAESAADVLSPQSIPRDDPRVNHWIRLIQVQYLFKLVNFQQVPLVCPLINKARYDLI